MHTAEHSNALQVLLLFICDGNSRISSYFISFLFHVITLCVLLNTLTVRLRTKPVNTGFLYFFPCVFISFSVRRVKCTPCSPLYSHSFLVCSSSSSSSLFSLLSFIFFGGGYSTLNRHKYTFTIIARCFSDGTAKTTHS